MSDPDDLPPFPVLMDESAERWRWPAVPYDWRHLPAADGAVEPCCIETASGANVDGWLVEMDPATSSLRFRTSAEGAPLGLPFASFRKLTLTKSLRGAEPLGGGIAERVPVAVQLREVRLHGADDHVVVERTAGHVEAPEGLYLFMPDDDERSLLRTFVPRCTYTRIEFGPTAQDLAAEHWIGTPQELLAAIDRQLRMPVLPLGQSLLELGYMTSGQLERALAQPGDEIPLGERLVAAGVISRADLNTAIAHKMGY